MYKFSYGSPSPASVWGVKARECVDISAKGAYNTLSGVAAVAASPIASISIGVKALQNGEGVLNATSKSLSYSASTLLQGLSRTVIGFVGIIAGILAGAGLELYDRFVCQNMETLRERGINVQKAFLISQAEKTYEMLHEEYSAADVAEEPEDETEICEELTEYSNASRAKEELNQKGRNAAQLPSSVKEVEGIAGVFAIYKYKSGLEIEIDL